MRNCYFILFTFCLGFSLNAQIVNIPDFALKYRLIIANPNTHTASIHSGNEFGIASSYHTIDINHDGEIQLYEALNIQHLTLDNIYISDFEWINSFSNLKSLSINYTNFTFDDISSLVELEYLKCSYNQLSSIDLSVFPNLQGFNCNYNPITDINLTGLVYLRYFNCNSGLLTNLDLNGLQNIRYLSCAGNQLTNLNLTGLINLQELNFSYNQITNINLEGLGHLTRLYCSNNLLTTLNTKNNFISKLKCNNNLLESLFIKNSIYYYSELDFNNNPNLEYICAREESFAQLNYLITSYGYSSTCHVNSYCSFTPGGTSYTIQGNNKFDNNNNGCDALDSGSPNLKFSINNGTVYGELIADNSGTYAIPVQGGTHAITPQLENPSYFTVSPTSASVTFPSTASPFIQNFCITPNGVHHDLEIVVFPIARARPGFDAIYKIKYKNKGNQNENATINFNYDDAILDYVSSSLSPTTQATGMLSWNIGTLAPFQSGEILVTLNVNSPTDTPPVNGGDILSYTANINGLNADETPPDNSFTLNQTVVNSFDPNDKTCLEGTTISPDKVGDYVHYMIRFENTGTANAQNIVVKDMIDTTKFDIASLVPIDGSHLFVTRITNTNQVEFIFENIQLPFDDANNDGYVVFKIKTKPTLVLGNTFSNTASIYFDYNFPIITNTATTTVSNVLANQDFDFVDYFSINPNPAKDILSIQTKENIEVSSINIYNTLGQLVLLIPNAKNISTIDVSSLKTGNYFIKVLSDKGVSSTKFIKE